MNDPIDENALFLGPKAENYEFFKKMLTYLMDDHAAWRRFFHPEDPPVVTEADRELPSFTRTLQRTQEALIDLAGTLQVSSNPWFSPRYLGHMNADTLMAANLGYMLTLLYNPNNCAYEGSPATTALEIETGRQLAALMGYDPKKAWGHITSGGTIANYEAIWLARNLASIPQAIRECCPELVGEKDEWALQNLPTEEILDLVDRAKGLGRFEEVRDRSVRGLGMAGRDLGVVLVPESKHYSWAKAVDIFGIGRQNLMPIPVGEDYRMDVGALESVIDALVAQKRPILAVVAVVGSTEEGAVDPVDRIVQLRERYAARGVAFYLHVDAAYGGYARSLFLDGENRFLEFAEYGARYGKGLVCQEVYEAFRAMSFADSITVDPHKLGYIPYSAGAIVAADRRIIDLISYFAAYVFEKGDDNPMLLGSYILEGSKPGAAVAAVWMAHRVVPLNAEGYGQIIGSSIEGAYRFARSLLDSKPLEVEGRRFEVRPLTSPDLNIVVYAFHEVGNGDLEEMNRLNQAIFEQCSYKSGPLYANDFITSKTSLTQEEYGNAPQVFLSGFGMVPEEWERVGSVYVLRSCILTPYLVKNTTYDMYWKNFMNSMERALRSYAEA